MQAAERRRRTLQGDQHMHTIEQTRPALELQLQGMTDKLRSRMTGGIRSRVEQTVVRTGVGINESLAIEAEFACLREVDGALALLRHREGRGPLSPGCCVRAGSAPALTSGRTEG